MMKIAEAHTASMRRATVGGRVIFVGAPVPMSVFKSAEQRLHSGPILLGTPFGKKLGCLGHRRAELPPMAQVTWSVYLPLLPAWLESPVYVPVIL